LNIDNSFIERISVEEMKDPSGGIEEQMERLSDLTDVIYVHVDLSILSADEIPDLPSSPYGRLTGPELAAVLETVFAFPKASAIGIASLPNGAGQTSIDTAYGLIEGAIEGVRKR
jgi:hypothetical protein